MPMLCGSMSVSVAVTFTVVSMGTRGVLPTDGWEQRNEFQSIATPAQTSRDGFPVDRRQTGGASEPDCRLIGHQGLAVVIGFADQLDGTLHAQS